MDREQKIDFLKRYGAGEASLEEIEVPEPFGLIIKDGDMYRCGDVTLTAAQVEEFMEVYLKPRKLNGLQIIYGMLVL